MDIFDTSNKEVRLDQYEKAISDLADRFHKADRKITDIQNRLNSPPIAAINQLRYAGYHLSQSLKHSKFESNKVSLDISNIISSYKHTIRAYYDALDHFGMFVDEQFKEIENRYLELKILITQYFPEYPNWKVTISCLNDIRKANDRVKENDKALEEDSKSEASRNEHYKKVEDKIESISRIYANIPTMYQTLSMVAQNIIDEEKRQAKIEERALQAEQRADRAEKLQKKTSYISLFAFIVAFLVFLFGNNIINNGATGQSAAAVNTP